MGRALEDFTEVAEGFGFGELVGRSARMQRVFGYIRRAAALDIDVLVLGETGTGKELVARAIHYYSDRRGGPFVPADCGAIAESLVESELFGHERGAFTGAQARKRGLLESARGGTLFLDELGLLPLRLQPKLLRVLEARTIRRVGGVEEIRLDVRIVAASPPDLDEQVETGLFRADVYYRLDTVRIAVPPLRERKEDIPLLAEHFCALAARRTKGPPLAVSAEAMECLGAYDWPGNVRQLRHVLEGVLDTERPGLIGAQDLPPEILAGARGRKDARTGGFMADKRRQAAALEEHELVALLRSHGGNIAAAARAAHTSRWTIYRLLRSHGLRAVQFRPVWPVGEDPPPLVHLTSPSPRGEAA